MAHALPHLLFGIQEEEGSVKYDVVYACLGAAWIWFGFKISTHIEEAVSQVKVAEIANAALLRPTRITLSLETVCSRYDSICPITGLATAISSYSSNRLESSTVQTCSDGSNSLWGRWRYS